MQDRRTTDPNIITLVEKVGEIHSDLMAFRTEMTGDASAGAGRIGKIETDVEDVKKRVNYTTGVFGGITAVGGFLAWLHNFFRFGK